MGQLLDDLGGKGAGQLILHTDWNALVQAVDSVQSDLTDFLADYKTNKNDVDKRLGDLEAAVDKLDDLPDRVDALEKDMAAYKANFRRLNVSTEKVRFLLSEQGELEAQVTDLHGDPVAFDGEDRPWIDFIASWGLLKPAAGFTSRDGEGGRAIAVRVDREGIARVVIRAEHGEGLSEDDEHQVADALKGRLAATQEPIGDLMLRAETPMEAQRAGVFQFLAAEYDREEAHSVRTFVDTAYRRYAPLRLVAFPQKPIHTWRDYRATVTAVLKADGDPTTADHGQAVASIQITFRDWIAPFAEIGYLPDFKLKENEFQRVFEANLDQDFIKSITNWKEKTKEMTLKKGWLGKQRNLRAAKAAIEKLIPSQDIEALPDMKRAMTDALRMQQAMDALPIHDDLGADIAMDVITNNHTSSGQANKAMQRQFAEISEDFTTIKGDVNIIKNRDDVQSDLEGQIKLLRDDLQKAENKLDNVNETVIRFDGTKLNQEIVDLQRKTRDFEGLVHSVRTENETVRRDAAEIAAKQVDMSGEISNLKVLNLNDVTQAVQNVSGLMHRIESLERGIEPD